MLGTIVNTGTILAGSIIGSVFKKGIKEKHQAALFTAMGMAATGLGINSVVQNMPKSNYLLIPRVSSERRRYIPIGFISPDILSSDSVHMIANASLYHFGILTSNVIQPNTIMN